jgi:putative Ca2+/H+ antiporter (TMEM165/GDT1 family)
MHYKLSTLLMQTLIRCVQSTHFLIFIVLHTLNAYSCLYTMKSVTVSSYNPVIIVVITTFIASSGLACTISICLSTKFNISELKKMIMSVLQFYSQDYNL